LVIWECNLDDASLAKLHRKILNPTQSRLAPKNSK
jgi:hypothetical protein